MEYTRLGRSDLSVSRVCMGCMGFGVPEAGQHSWTLGEEQSREIIKRGIELGVNFFDTSAAYQGGTSEQFLGRAVKDFAKREDIVIATKFLPMTDDEIRYLEEMYVPHKLVGVMAQNTAASAGNKQVWNSK